MARDSDDDCSSSLATLIDEEKSKLYKEVQTSPSKPSFLRRHKLPITILSLLILFTPILYFISKAAAPYSQCGTSPAEARSRGCIFEVTGFTWLPRACRDSNMEDQFLEHLKSHNLSYFRDLTYTETVPLSEVRRGDQGFFVAENYHKAHCVFLLRKLHNRYAEGKLVDGLIMNQNHTKHCVSEMIEGEIIHKDAVGSWTYLKYPYCGKMGGYNLLWPEQETWS